MFNKIRNQLMDEQQPAQLAGEVEADETYIGGKLRQSEKNALRSQGRSNMGAATKKRAIVFAAVERSGRVRAEVLPFTSEEQARKARTVVEKVHEFVLPASVVYTDDYGAYLSIRGYRHRRINHSARVYVSGETHTQTIEGFFGLFKTGLVGAHHSVSRKWLQGYLNEWAWRYNRRESDVPMFYDLLDTAVSRRV